MWLDLTTSHRQTWLFSVQLHINVLLSRPPDRTWRRPPGWSSTEQVARPATKRFHPSDWRPLEACCRPWTWWCNDATALAGYAKTSTTMMMATVFAEACATTVSADHRDEVPASDSALSLTMHALQIMILLYCVVFYKHWQRW